MIKKETQVRILMRQEEKMKRRLILQLSAGITAERRIQHADMNQL